MGQKQARSPTSWRTLVVVGLPDCFSAGVRRSQSKAVDGGVGLHLAARAQTASDGCSVRVDVADRPRILCVVQPQRLKVEVSNRQGHGDPRVTHATQATSGEKPPRSPGQGAPGFGSSWEGFREVLATSLCTQGQTRRHVLASPTLGKPGLSRSNSQRLKPGQ